MNLADAMLEPILGSASSERALIFILAQGKGYVTEIAGLGAFMQSHAGENGIAAVLSV